MSEFLKLLFSLSLSGAIVTLVLMLLQRLFHGILSKRWVYYAWLIVFVRLLFPITIPESLVGNLFAMKPAAPSLAYHEPIPQNTAEIPISADTVSAAEPTLSPTAAPQPAISVSVLLFAGWGMTALLLLMRKVTQYQSFTRYLRAGSAPVADPALLDCYAEVCALTGVARPPELRTSALTPTPMLIDIRRPYIVLPDFIEGRMLEKVLLHELLHHKRCDVVYKWFAQAALCLHWFNPAVWLAVRSLEKDCELACDEAALRLMQPEDRRIYGDALLQTVRTEYGYRPEVASLALSENAKLLKERLGMIMNFRKRNRIEKTLSVCLTFALCVGSIAVGAYASETPRTLFPLPSKQDTAVKADASTPEGALELAMQAVKALDSSALCRYSNNQNITFSAIYFDGHTTMFGNGMSRGGQKGPALLAGKQDFYPEIVRALSWKIGKCSVLGDTANITLHITNRDFGGVMADIISTSLLEAAEGKNNFDEDENLKLFQAVPDSKSIMLTVSAKMQKKNGNWELQIDGDFANAVCGNLFEGQDTPESKLKISAAEKILNEYIQKSVKDALGNVNIQKETEEAMKDVKDALVNVEEEVRDAMKAIDIKEEIREAMEDAFR